MRINHLAVIASVIAHQIIGTVWYGMVFLDIWSSGWGIPSAEAAQPQPVPIAIDVFGWLIASYVMAWLIRQTRSESAAAGAKLGAIVWLGVAAPTLVAHYVFGQRPSGLIVIDAANALVGFVVTGAIIGGWRRRAVGT